MLRWAIAGFGRQAATRMAPAIDAARDTELAGVWSLDMTGPDAFAKARGAFPCFASYAGLLADPSVDVVYISTPNYLHVEHVIQAAEAGKHIMCEKPMALSVADAVRMVQACDKAGVKLGIALQNRQHPAHQEIRRLTTSGEGGTVVMATAQYCHNFPPNVPWTSWRNDPALSGGGGLMGMGVHALDLLCFVIGQPVVEVTAFSDADAAAGKIDTIMTCLLRFKNGSSAFAASSLHLPNSKNDLVVYSSTLRMEARGTIGMPWQGDLVVTRQAETSLVEFPCQDPAIDLFVRLIEDHNRSILDDSMPLASGRDGLALVQVTDAVIRSARDRLAVRIEQITG